MTFFSNKIIVAVAGFLLTVSAFTAAFIAEPIFYAVPLLLIGTLFFVQHPYALFYTLLFSIPWSAEVTVNESLGTDLPDEPLMLLMAFSVIAMGITYWKKIEWRKKLPALLFILLIQLAWISITVLLSTYFLLSLKYLLAKSWYLLAFVGAPLILKGDKSLIRKSALVLFSSMLLVTCVGLYRHATLNFTFATVNSAFAPFFRNHVNYSALLVFMVPLIIAFYRLEINVSRRRLLLLLLLIVLTALYLSYARGAWLALVVGTFTYWLVKKGWLLHSFILFLLVIGSFVFWLQYNDRYLAFAPKHDTTIFHEDFSEHLTATYQGTDVSTAERFYRWIAGVRMTGERWETGFGPTTFYQHYKSYTIPLFRTWVSDNKEQSTVHNYFLLLLIEQGVIGLILFLLLTGTMFWYAQSIYKRTNDIFWKITAATIAAILWMQCTLNSLSDLIETDKAGSVFYLCLAFLIIADAKTRKEQTNKEINNHQKEDMV